MKKTNIIPTPSLELEDLKNRFLAALYQNKSLDNLFHTAYTAADLTETDEKHLRQILVACKRFSKTQSPGFKRLQNKLRDKARQTTLTYTTLSEWESRLDLKTWQTRAMLRHAITFQLTSGCSNFCRRCNEWALPRVRGHFTHNAVTKILNALLQCNNDDLALYGGSDPLDWQHDGIDLSGLLDQLPKPIKYSILTKIPNGKIDLASKLVKNQIPLSVSLTRRNATRIRELEKRVGHKISKQHATDDLLIPACLDEDFKTIKPSITDAYGTEIATDGAYIIIPAFTSALYPMGHKKIPITKETEFFPVKKLGRPALLVDYFKPLEVEGPNGNYHLGGLLDVQVENILLDNGEYTLTPPGMRSIKEYFEIFDDKARRQRKKMTVSVIRRLRTEILKGRSLFQATLLEQQRYREKLSTHLDFTLKSKVAAARVTAAAYFLASARAYLSIPTPKTDIIAHLTRKEYDRLDTSLLPAPKSASLAEQFANPETNAWKLFRYHTLRLVHEKNPDSIDQFLSKHRAEFDAERDMFTSQTTIMDR